MTRPPATAPIVAPIVAIDGPAGAGKSTASKALARRLGVFLLDTGAIYRSVALLSREQGVAWDDETGCAALARTLPIRFVPGEPVQRVLLADRDVTSAIRTPEISDGASRVSSHPAVRAALLDLQRTLAAHATGGCVVEGRDIGTVVLPEAPVKFFLTASPEARARRRDEELRARGERADYARTLGEIRERDRRDETRAAAPLRPAPDAIHLDTSNLHLNQVVDRLETLTRQRMAALAE